jgi:ABC-type branched-subunit amino acid transport system substrate-binding protein
MDIEKQHRSRIVGATLAFVLVAGMLSACSSVSNSTSSSGGTSGTASPGATSRGFDGKTVTVAGLGIKAQFPSAQVASEARVNMFNETNEIPGIKLKYAEFADDKQDQATALSEARRLVSEDKIFAIVGDVSQANPAAYLTQQHVPWFGMAFDASYCSPTESKNVWGFGISGCLIPPHPKVAPDALGSFYNYVKQQTGKSNPTIAIFGNDTDSGVNAVKGTASGATGVGFDVVYAKGALPPPPISDYTPYVQQVITSDHGHAPDAVECLLAADCIPMYTGLVNGGFKGSYLSNLYSDLIVKPMSGSLASSPGFAPFDQSSPGLEQMKKYMSAVDPKAPIDIGAIAGWGSTDMFIQALKAAYRSGGISPENVQAKAATMTWEIKDFIGPTEYPASTVHSTPACGGVVKSDGTAWKTVEPYTCSTKTFPVS